MDNRSVSGGSRGSNRSKESEEARRQRSETTIQIRKEKREEQMNRRRRTGNIASDPNINISFGNDDPNMNTQIPNSGSNISQHMILEHKKNIMSDNAELQLKSTIQFRRLLSIERQPPIEMVIAENIVPRLVQFLHAHQNTQLQFEAAWALTNIASGTSEHTKAVIDSGACPVFIKLLESDCEDVREQAAWALGNVAGDSVECRNMVLQLGAMPALLRVAGSFHQEGTRLSLIRNTTWTISNLCRGKPIPTFHHVSHALPLLARLLHSQDMETVTDACWALSYLSDGPNEPNIAAVLNEQVHGKLVGLLTHPNSAVATPALRTVGNIVTGTDEQTQIIVNLNCIPALLWLLSHPKKNIRKEACWTLSNIAAGNTQQIEALITADVFPKLIELLRDAEFDIKKEACWAVSNATSEQASPEQIMRLVDLGCIPPLCKMLDELDVRIIGVALDGIENILRTSAAPHLNMKEKVLTILDDCQGVDEIEKLQSNSNEQIYQRARRIIEEYLGGDDEDDQGFIAPEQTGNQYQFGPGAGTGQDGNVFRFG